MQGYAIGIGYEKYRVAGFSLHHNLPEIFCVTIRLILLRIVHEQVNKILSRSVVIMLSRIHDVYGQVRVVFQMYGGSAVGKPSS